MRSLEISESRLDEKSIRFELAGEVNIQTSSELRRHLKPYLIPEVESIHIALDEVSFMDSSGIATLVEGLQWSNSSGGRFVLSGLSENVRDLFSLAKLDTVFEIVESDR